MRCSCPVLACCSPTELTPPSRPASFRSIALDTSYAIPIACKLIFRNHPEVSYRAGPFRLAGLLGTVIPLIACGWVAFTVVCLACPESLPVTAATFNYSWVITLGVVFCSLVWYAVDARKRYFGPRTCVLRSFRTCEERH